MLEHLAVQPRGGVCNRLRAMASAKRLCSQVGARCTVVWDWGAYDALFADGTDWIPCVPEMEPQPTVLIPGFVHIRHLSEHEGGNYRNRRIPVTTHRRISEAHMPSLTAGLHMRRTDHEPALRRSPDEAYFKEADRLVHQDCHLFLGTDNPETLAMMQARYGSRILSSPKRAATEKRWPRAATEVEDAVEDMVDLWLLASCELVIGSACSSFSRVAMRLNGSPRCIAIDRALPRWRSRFEQRWQRLTGRVSSNRWRVPSS